MFHEKSKFHRFEQIYQSNTFFQERIEILKQSNFEKFVTAIS